MSSTPFAVSPSSASPSSTAEYLLELNNSWPDLERKEKMKDVAHYTQAECLAFLEANNLFRLVPRFVEAEVDGPLLVSLSHPTLGASIIEGMGINKSNSGILVKAIKSKVQVNSKTVTTVLNLHCVELYKNQ